MAVGILTAVTLFAAHLLFCTLASVGADADMAAVSLLTQSRSTLPCPVLSCEVHSTFCLVVHPGVCLTGVVHAGDFVLHCLGGHSEPCLGV